MTQAQALKILKCLSDASRLNIVRALTQEDTYAELLAQRLDLTPSTVSFHMKKLEEAGLVCGRKEQYYTVYSLNREAMALSLLALAACEPEQMDAQLQREEEYRQKVIRAFFDGEKLRAIPVQRKKKLICYELIAQKLEIGRVYGEKELTGILSPIHEDYCTVRRDMISEGILTREGTTYRRVK